MSFESERQQFQKLEIVGSLAVGIAHDFNNILFAILGYSELALSNIDDKKSLKRTLNEVIKAGNRARDLIKQILKFCQRSDLEKKPVQVKPIIQEALKFLRASIPTTIEIRQKIESNSTILADATQIYQILMNLCINAVNAMNKMGGVLEIDLTNVELDQKYKDQNPNMIPGLHIRLTVRDTGHGISPNLIKKIFTPFFTTKKPGDGTGLGLSIVQEIVRNHNGIITIDSALGEGSVFKIFFPVIEEQTLLVSSSITKNPTDNERILFVDDEDLVVKLNKTMLSRFGYSVEATNDSVDALEIFKTRPEDFDLVITDMTMPRMTGLELANELKKIRSNIPIILFTGLNEMMDGVEMTKNGIKECLLKPVKMTDLVQSIRRLLDKNKEGIKENL